MFPLVSAVVINVKLRQVYVEVNVDCIVRTD